MVNLFSNIKNIVSKSREKQTETLAASPGSSHEAAAPAHINEEPAAKLVVMGNGSAFSNEIIDYALEMSQRMNYEILALNTAPLSCETFHLFPSSRNSICREFHDMATKNAAAFQSQAEARGLHFTHCVKFVDTDTALEEIQKEFGENIGFIVSEPEAEEQAITAQARQEKRPEAEILVYSMI